MFMPTSKQPAGLTFERNGKVYHREWFIRCLMMMPLGPRLLRATHPQYFNSMSSINGRIRN